MKLTSTPVVQQFDVLTDPEKKMKATFRQATFGESKELADLTRKQRRIWQDGAVGQVTMEQEYNFLEERALKIYLTCCDITGCVDEETGEELFEFVEHNGVRRPKNKQRFLALLDRMPDEMVNELHNYCMELNPQWGVAGN